MYEHIRKLSKEHYERALAQFGDTPQGVDWCDKESQRLRFKILCEIDSLNGKTIHDVGCGLAHMADYLEDRGIKCNYIGSDISSAMIEQAKLRLSNRVELHVADILNGIPNQDIYADYVIASGLYNVKGDVDTAAWYDFVKSMILKMFEYARCGISFNIMTSYVDFYNNQLFYLPPAEMLDFCIQQLSHRVVIRHDYPLWEYTTYVYK